MNQENLEELARLLEENDPVFVERDDLGFIGEIYATSDIDGWVTLAYADTEEIDQLREDIRMHEQANLDAEAGWRE